MKSKIIVLLILLFYFLGSPLLVLCEESHNEGDVVHEIGTVFTVNELVISAEEAEMGVVNSYEVELRVESGPLTGRVFKSQIQSDSLFKGKRYIIRVDRDGEQVEVNLLQLYRGFHLKILFGIFIVAVILVGGWNGIKALISLVGTLAFILFFFLPFILKGYPPVFLAILVCVFSTTFTVLINQGWSKKSLAAILGTAGGVTVGGMLAWVAGSAMDLSGVMEQETVMLYYSLDQKISLQGLLFAGIIIGALGAVMDVAVSIASSLWEIQLEKDEITFKRLLKHGFQIGTDVISTMVNTLILAYAGSSLSLILLLKTQNVSATKFLSFDMIAAEITRSLAGSIGIVVTVPLTAALASWLYTRKQKEQA
jgi:uncharacterized membrane protein